MGWDVAKSMTAELALGALRLAKLLRQPKDSALVHSDQGSQYTSGEWRDYAASNGVELSQSRRGNCWDNAVMKRFFSSLKSEWMKERCYPDAESAKRYISK
ncbi:DDE-type integrase/transposase/recombinase [Pantoea endophytica]|uniref:DDE-type integrase/transposase/recombinase n=1 Tax=Pantoea endophytica TaxID=92488 RepID=UPI002413A55A|nr:DDE-type integrase/transposase/recombinase [Pantoea endophytica]